ncbi:DNA repair protein REV1 [Erpetoichthys calabaricus]|uniref:DNA repair protein REV1 n=1 Tax=Erpetoichthys calabaricus TaxID=27687 RepID=UPI00223427F0|nr:DNA repair protein REV1 [Erpetoichthys calabaricus]
MSRGGWRKRASEDDGWGGRGGYMAAKVCKLEEQFRHDAPKQQQHEGISSSIFSGVAIYVNGYTNPTADELRKLMMVHGGQYHMYYSRSKTTHIIASNLPNSKIKELKGEKVVRPEWITDSIKAGRLLSYLQYQLYSRQKSLNFNNVCKLEEPTPGPSNIPKELETRVNGTAKKLPDIMKNVTVKLNGWNGLDNLEEEEEFELNELEPISPVHYWNAFKHSQNPASIANGHAHSSNGALKPLEQTLHPGRTSIGKSPCSLLSRKDVNKELGEMRDYGVQQYSNQNADTHLNLSCPADPPPLHSNIKVNGAHHISVQGPSPSKSTYEPCHKQAAPMSPPSAHPRTTDSSFISEFYSHSRLHHISTWKCEFTDFVNNLQRQSNGFFPGKDKLKRLKNGRVCQPSSDTGNTGPHKHQTCIMHVDMDCFFVSVGIRDKPDLKGKPIAVTSNRGGGRTALRPGTNIQLEMQYYKRRYMKSKGDETKVPGKGDVSASETPDAGLNGVDLDLAALSMAEIASCSYEARQAGIKNGMFFGQAKKLCPSLQSVPYDFNAYKEVALTMYETLASYTHEIEAVSCDEALLDVTDILTDLGLTPDCIANAVRAEIKEKTKCTASVGMASNILLARMATRKAKPDGQCYLKPEEIDDFIRDQLVTSLPGVGKTMGYKLGIMGVRTCGDLQQLSMAKLQKEFGPKTGQTLYRFCRGLDDRPVKTDRQRKSVSAEINYGIRFTQASEAEGFLLDLSDEIQRRLEAAGVRGRRLTLKVMVRKLGAPLEPAKFGGHGICDSLTRTVNLEQATDNSRVICREALKLFYSLKLNVSDVRGVGMQINHLIPVQRRNTVTSPHVAQPYSVKDLLMAKRSKRLSSVPAETCESTSPDKSLLLRNSLCSAPFKQQLTEPTPGTSKSEPVVRYNGGLHTPSKSRANLSIEVPSPSQIDHSVLEALPADIKQQVEQVYLSKSEETPNGFVMDAQPVDTLILQIPEQLGQNSNNGIIVALPEFSQVDPEVFAALPLELQEELKAAYGQRQKTSEGNNNQQLALVTRNPLLHLKQPIVVKTKKRSKKKNVSSPVKKVESPLKVKLLHSPMKNSAIHTRSPQKLIPDFLKREEAAADKLKLETGPSTSGLSTVSQVQGTKASLPQGPNLAGAFELTDIKMLLKEWVTTISDPMEEDILQVVRYCTELIEDKDLEKLDLVIKYMKRLMQQSVDSVWSMAFDFILDNIQVVIQQMYGSTLKIT